MKRPALPVRPDSIVVRCARRAHRVRLARGKFWRGARCTACGAAVDPTRLERVARGAVRLLLPAARRGRPWWLWIAVVSYAFICVVAAAILWGWGDRWWLATGILFGPRWVLLLPLPVLLVAALAVDRALTAVLLVAGLIVIGPIMGLQLGWRGWLEAGSHDHVLRVGTFNAGGNILAHRIRSLPLQWQTDILAVQECGATLHDALATTVGWHVDLRTGLCLISRYPIIHAGQMDREAFSAAGGAGLVATYTIDLGRDTIRITNLHLETPRAGLERLREGDLAGGIPELLGRQTLREIEHRHARAWTDSVAPPQLVMGDFNAPVESVIYRASWADWTNAYSAVGWGFGTTRMNGWIRVRIDHVLADPAWRVRRAWVGPDAGSDHRPMLAEVSLRDTR